MDPPLLVNRQTTCPSLTVRLRLTVAFVGICQLLIARQQSLCMRSIVRLLTLDCLKWCASGVMPVCKWCDAGV